MFENNISALEKKNPELAKKLRETELVPLEVYNSQSGDIIIGLKDVLLHSEEDPKREAELLFTPKLQNDSPKSIYLIFGLGLGYLFKRAFISTKGRIIVFEPLIEVLRFTLQYVDFSKEIAADNVFICNTIEETISVISERYLSGDNMEIAYLPGYIKLCPQIFEKLTEKIIIYIKEKQQDQNTILNRSKVWGYTTLENLNDILESLPADIFENKFKDYPVLIASAGPSLEQYLPLIKEHRNKFILMCVNTSLRALLKNDIIPDFCVVAEAFNISFHFKGLQNLDNIRFILSNRVQHFIWNIGKKPNITYFTKTDGFSNWYNSILENKYKLWPSAGTVSLLAFYVATRVFKSKQIILAGQDLAFVDNKFYSPSIVWDNEDIKIDKEKIVVKSDYLDRVQHYNKLKTVWVKNSKGGEVLTSLDYAQYIQQYEEIIRYEIPKDTKILNTSIDGAYINGMTYITLDEIVNDLSPIPEPQIEIIEKSIESALPEIEVNKTVAIPKIKEFFNTVDEMLARTNQLKNFIEVFSNKLDQEAKPEVLNLIINNYYEYKKELSQFVTDQAFIFSILQKANYHFATRFIMPSPNMPLTLQQFIVNMYVEKLLLLEVEEVLIRCKESMI